MKNDTCGTCRHSVPLNNISGKLHCWEIVHGDKYGDEVCETDPACEHHTPKEGKLCKTCGSSTPEDKIFVNCSTHSGIVPKLYTCDDWSAKKVDTNIFRRPNGPAPADDSDWIDGPTAGHEPGETWTVDDVIKLVDDYESIFPRLGVVAHAPDRYSELKLCVDEIKCLRASAPTLAAENEKLRTAIEFYANKERYNEGGAIGNLVGTADGNVFEYDLGQMARTALTEGGKDVQKRL